MLVTRCEGDGAVLGAVGDCDPGFLGNSIGCFALLELGRNRDVRFVSSDGLGERRSCYFVPGREANGNTWNGSQDGGGEVLREIHLERWV